MDVTSHSDLVFVDGLINVVFPDLTLIQYNQVFPTVTDLTNQIVSINGKEMCTLVGEASSTASNSLSTSECGCS